MCKEGTQEQREVYYQGRVQGVGFRYAVRSLARRFAVDGFVRNLSDGRVELVAEGGVTRTWHCSSIRPRSARALSIGPVRSLSLEAQTGESAKSRKQSSSMLAWQQWLRTSSGSSGLTWSSKRSRSASSRKSLARVLL